MNAPAMPPQLRGYQPRLLLDANSNGLLMSQEEFDAITEDDCDPRYRYELLNGVVIVSPTPSDGEIDPNDELGHMLRSYQETPEGNVLDKTLFEREVATRIGIRRVDRALWIGFGRAISSKVDLPTIIVEFVSPDGLFSTPCRPRRARHHGARDRCHAAPAGLRVAAAAAADSGRSIHGRGMNG